MRKRSHFQIRGKVVEKLQIKTNVGIETRLELDTQDDGGRFSVVYLDSTGLRAEDNIVVIGEEVDKKDRILYVNEIINFGESKGVHVIEEYKIR